MNRRETLKAIGITAVSGAALLSGCTTAGKKEAAGTIKETGILSDGREAFEIACNAKLNSEKFFTAHEMATLTVLADIIIPRDEKSGSASDAGVPEFIEFMVKDMPVHQVPLRGGIRWLDFQSMSRYNDAFKDALPAQQIEMVSDIAYPKNAQPGMEQGVAFFNRMRDLTASGFYTSQMGMQDLGYVGNVPNNWEGVPADILAQYGMQGI